MGFAFADLLGFCFGLLSLFFCSFLFSVVVICVFLAGVKSRRVIWRVEELLNRKKKAGVKVWEKEKMREMCVCVERHRRE